MPNHAQIESFRVAGMTCAHCVTSVTEEISLIDGVTAVTVDLKPAETSTVTVTSDGALSIVDVDAAVREAGYELVSA